MPHNIEQIRNIGIIAHIDAGKTTVTERMLFLSGFKHRVGMVDKGTTTTDDDPEEEERGITIYSACVMFDWAGVHINLLDTPGHVDFTAEVERSLRVLDGAVVVFSAREGVEAQSETVWRQADKYHVPRIAFINKLDREGADFDRVIEQIQQRFSGVGRFETKAYPVRITIPVGQGPSHVDNPFRGVIDLIEMEFLTFEDEGKTINRHSIPADYVEEADYWRSQLISDLSNFSDELMELAIEEQPVSAELIHKVLREATLSHMVQPVLCGSALHGIGVQLVLDAVARYLPSPLDRPPVRGINLYKKNAEEIRNPDPKEPFCALVFKILPAKTGDLYWIRVYSGTLAANTRVLCPAKDKKENIAQLWQIHASKKERDGQVDKVTTGEIVCAIGPRYAVTGDTLCDAKAPIQLESITFPETVIEMAIEPESTADRQKLADTLEMLKRQDPTFKASESVDTGQTLIAGMGELHLEVIKNRLLRDFNLNVKVHQPRVSYRETVAGVSDVIGECHRVVGGQQLFAKVRLKIEPDETCEAGIRVLNLIPPEKFIPEICDTIVEELTARGQGGGLIGCFPLAKIRISILDIETEEQGSNAMAFSIAASDGFEKGLNEAGPVLLEPVMRLAITSPTEYHGDLANDLSRRRAIIVSTDSLADMTIIEAHAPLAELFGYANAIRSLSQGRAACSIEPLEYQPAPELVLARFGV
ncbi:MAG TPA: elongation factor G [Pirellulaceae bacterium]|nr:elongation factor G [Pirellulaceae bacterium]HMO92476.1 elongation factor G [Pirellulaceae bacterium]HMP67854.1 elongation factor G [Pirellulaceae bacterium]